MTSLTIEEEQNHVFSKEQAQKLIIELNSFLTVLLYFCKGKLADTEEGEQILSVLKYIKRTSNSLYFELEAWKVY